MSVGAPKLGQVIQLDALAFFNFDDPAEELLLK
jgi:hypothetical protein